MVATPTPSSDSSKDTPKEDFESQSGAVAAWNAIHPDSQRTADNPSSLKVDTDSDAYKAGYQGLQDAWNKYQELNANSGTQATKDYSREKLDSGKDPNNPNDVDSDLNTGNFSTNTKNQAQIPKDPNAGEAQASNELKNQVSGGTNNSVNNYNNQITFDDKNKITISNENSTYYNQGITDFLKYQGTYDAETGRWSGQKQNDAYTPSKDSQNAYDQAYMGAQSAINQQFKSDNTFSYDVNNPNSFNPNEITNASSNYDAGFKHAKDKIINGTAFVSNGVQINNALNPAYQVTDPKSLSRASIYYYGQIKNISFINDINYQDSTYSSANGVEQYVYIYPYASSNGKNGNNGNVHLTFDGQNHVTDFGGLAYSLQPYQSSTSDPNPTNLTVQNFHTIYGSDYWGAMKLENRGNITYNNITYIGSQFVNARNANVYVNGNLNVFSVGSYISPWIKDKAVATQDSSNIPYDHRANTKNKTNGVRQQNMEINNLTLNKGGNYYGSGTGGDLIDIYGNVNLNDGSNMKLVPMNNDDNTAESAPDINAVGLNISSGNLNINKGANVEIDPTTNPVDNGKNTYKGLAQGIYVGGTMTIDGGKLFINDNGPLSYKSTKANYISGNVTVKNDGYFEVYGSNIKDSTNSSNQLIYIASGNLSVNNHGNLYVHTDGSGNVNDNLYLVYNYGSFNIDNPGKSVTLQIGKDNGSYGNLFYSKITAYSVKYAIGYNSNGDIVENSTPYYQITVPADSGSKIQYYDINQHSLVNSNDSAYGAKYLSFDATPNAYFDGPMSLQNETDGSQLVNGKIKLANVPSAVDHSTTNDNGYIKFTINDTNSDTNLTPVDIYVVDSSGNRQGNVQYYYDKSSGKYMIKVPDGINSKYESDNDIQFSYLIPNGQNNTSHSGQIIATSDYYVMSQKQTLDSNGFTTASTNPAYGRSTSNLDSAMNTSLYAPSSVTLNDNGALSDGERDGINDAADGNPKNSEGTNAYKNYYSKDHSGLADQYKDSYNHAFDGYNQGMVDLNHDLDSSKSTERKQYDVNNHSDENQQYKDGYLRANSDLQSGFKDKAIDGQNNDNTHKNTMYSKGQEYATGALNAVNGTDNTVANDSGNVNQGKTYFNSGYNDALSGQTTTGQPNNPAYNYGVNMANGMKDASNSGSVANKPTDTSDVTSNTAYQNGRDAYNGINDALSGQSKGTNNSDKSSDAKDAYNATYDAAQEGLKGNPNTNKYDNLSPQWTAYNSGAAARRGELDGQSGNGKKSSDYNSNSGDTPYIANNDSIAKIAYDRAKGNFESGAGRNKDSNASQDQSNAFSKPDTKSQAYLDGQAAKQGQDDAANGTNGKNDDDPQNGSYRTLTDQQKSAYDRANSAYNDGLKDNKDNPDDKVANDAGKSAKQGIADAFTGATSDKGPDSNSYDAAKKAAQDGMNSQPASNDDQKQLNAYNTGKAVKAAMQAAQSDGDKSHDSKKTDGSGKTVPDSAYSSGLEKLGLNKDNLSDQQKAQKNDYNQAYTAYKDGATNGSNKDNPAGDVDSNSIQSLAYKAGQTGDAVANGIKDAKSGKESNPSNYNYNDDPQKSAYNNAYSAYKDGFNQQSNTSAVNNNQGDAYNQGRDAQSAVQDASQNSTPTGTHSDAYNEAYTAYKNGVSDSTNSSSKSNNNNELAYEAGETAQATKDGIADAASSGLSNNEGKYQGQSSSATELQKSAYENAKKAYNGGFNGTTTSDKNNSSQSDAVNNNQGDAYNQGLAAKAAVQDAQSGKYNYDPTNASNGSMNSSSDSSYNGSKPSGNDWTSNQQKVYKDAYQAYLDGKANTNTDPSTVSGIDKNQNLAYQDGQSSGIAPQAINDSINGNNTEYSSGSEKGNKYSGAKDSFNAGFNDPNGTSQRNSNQYSNPDAYQAGQAAYKAVSDASTGSNLNNRTYPSGYSDSQKQAYDLAYKDYQAGTKKSPEGTDVNKTDNNQSAAYAAGSAARDGINAAENNNFTPKTTDGKSGSELLNNQSYNTAQSAYKQGLAGQTVAQDTTTGNKAGLDARKGINDALSGNNNNNPQTNPSPSADYTNAYQAAKAGKDGKEQGKSEGQPGYNQDIAYQAGIAYNKGLNDIKNGGQNHSDQYNDNGNKPDYLNDPQKSAQKSAYEQAQQDYRDGLNKNSTPNTNSDGYKDGFNQRATNQGINDASDGKDTNSVPDDYNGNQDASDAYKNAGKSFKNGYSNPTKDPDGTETDKSAYRAGQAANKGVVDSQAGNHNVPSDYTDVQKSAYNKAQQDYQAGLDGTGVGTDSKGKPTNSYPGANGSAYQAGVADQKSINAAINGATNAPEDGNQAAFDAAKAGVTGNPIKDSDKQAQQHAFDMGSAARKAISDASNGNYLDSNGQTVYPKDADQAKVYDQAKKEFNAGLANNDDPKNPDGSAMSKDSEAYKAGQAAYNAIKDDQQGQSKDQGDPTLNQAYQNSQKAYNAGLSGDTTSPDKAQLNPVANKAGYDAKQAISDAIANNGSNYDNGSNDYKAAYNAAKAGRYGQNKPTSSGDQGTDKTNGSDQASAYEAGKAAFDGYKNAENGQNNLPGSSTKVPNSPNAQINNDIYTNAQNAYKAGLKGDSTSNTAQLDPTANKAGIDAKNGIHDAIAKGQNAPDPSQSEDYKDAYNAAKAGNTGNNQPAASKADNGESLPQGTAYQAGQAAQQGITDVQVNKNNSGQYDGNTAAQDSYNTAQKSYNDGLSGQNNTQAAKDNPQANKLGQANKDGINAAISGNDDSLNKYSGDDSTNTAARDIYNKAKNAYNAGISGDDSSEVAKSNYPGNQSGYDVYVNGQNNSGSSNGSINFINGGNGNLNGNSYYNSGYSNGFTKAQAGFTDGINGKSNGQPNDANYGNGYQAAKDYADGIDAARKGKPMNSNGSYAYNVGYNSYKDGANGKAYKPNYNMNQAYQDAAKKSYDEGRAKYLEQHGKKPGKDNVHKNNNLSKAERAGREHAASGRVSGLFGRSKAYKDAYMDAFNEAVKRNLPSYVYNLKKIYSHDAPALTRKTRVNKYAKTPRYARHVFKVLGYKITSSGQVVYKVKGLGWISANDKSVDNLYYRRHDTKKPIAEVRVIKPEGTYIYNSKNFNDKTAIKKVKRGSTVKVERIEKVGGITRFYIGDGKYISSNKTIVEHVNSKGNGRSVNNLYYRRHDTKKPIQKVRVIKSEGTYIYNSKDFNDKTAVKKMKKGSTVNVKSIETVGGITRFYIGDGQYISSNKTIVEHVR
ncbi:DUF5776 domain-containing protein [Apilactobacillus micheneri]|uniref:DUF5776 domain-containing protein n=1 Tax=Apilactobacillus micheneri TaxID=1899430 RepID=UPI0033419518